MTRKSAKYAPKPASQPAARKRRGFAAMSGLIEGQIRRAGEKRGFAVMRLLTHWAEIVGEDTAKMARPVDVGYSRDGFGATLTVLCSGSTAPLVQQMAPQIREKVNACYGYSAISRVRITQTAPVGFAEGQMQFDAGPRPGKPEPGPEIVAASTSLARDVESDGLRRALEQLGQNVLAKNRST